MTDQIGGFSQHGIHLKSGAALDVANASLPLKADLSCVYVCLLLTRLDNKRFYARGLLKLRFNRLEHGEVVSSNPATA